MHPSRRTWRVRGVPPDFDKKKLADVLRLHPDLQCPNNDTTSDPDGANGANNDNGARVHTLAPDLRLPDQVAAIRFHNLPSRLRTLKSNSQLSIDIDIPPENPPAGAKRKRESLQTARLTVDERFDGVTVLSSPSTDEKHQIDVLAISGLGSHPFGSFVNKRDGFMWLSDSLHRDMPAARVMIYGYESELQRSTSFAHFGDLAGSLQIAISQLLRSEKKKRLILIGHSLGGLLIKEALIRIADSKSKSDLIDLIFGVLFFGVPNDGMDIESLVPMVNDQPNRLLLESLNPMNSQILRLQKRNFSSILSRPNLEVFCFYETELSPTATKDPTTGQYKMGGSPRCLVSASSATSCLPPEASPDYSVPIPRTHSDLVKFACHDSEYDKVAYILRQMYQRSLDHIRTANSHDTYKMDESDQECLKDLRATDPRNDKTRIEQTKGGLLADSYRWILDNADFRKWREDPKSRLLWIKGDPGKGKTMLLCGIVDELNKPTVGTALLSYFFCQATDSRTNKATAVLRGLIYMLVSQQPSLISHVRAKYDQAGKMLFEDANAWVVLSEILTNILHDSDLQTTYLIIDALDECEKNRPELLAFIAQNSSVSSRVKWLVSSRNWPDIEEQINTANQKVKLSLELNEKSISMAVNTYIEWKIEQLVKQKGYDNDTRDAVKHHLLLNANNTFLWVALVYQQLTDPNVRRHHTLMKLDAFPPGLNDLYWRMMGQIRDSEDAELCKRILAVVSVVYTPVTLDELESFVDMPTGASLTEIIELCGSFLTLQERIISFVHQSAKEYLLKEAASEIFPPGREHIQHRIFSCSIQVMDKTLQQNIFKLDRPAILVNEIKPPNPDPLAAIRYSCVYWVEHLHSIPDQVLDYENKLLDNGAILTFFKKHFLHWLEVLSLIKRLSESISMIDNLLAIVDGKKSPNLYSFIYDAKRFALSNRLMVEQAPLQLYCSSLIFAPGKSIVRRQFEECIPAWIQTQPKAQADWSTVLQTLEGHSSRVKSVAFSPDGKLVVSGSRDRTGRVWDAATGALLQTLEGHSSRVNSVAFSPNGQAENTLLVSKGWIADGGANILWLPVDYRSPTCIAVWNRTLALGYSSGRVFILGFKEGLKLI